MNLMNTLSGQPKDSTTLAVSLGNLPIKSIGFAVTSLALGLLVTSPAQASTFTRGSLPTGVSEVGGIVVDLTGSNGTRVVTQAAASGLFRGNTSPTTNPLTVGTQTGFTPTVIAALGGGISQASVRVSLFDGDSAAGNFDVNDNTLLLNGINFGNFTGVQAQNTSGSGLVASGGFSGGGFRNDTLDTGFFVSNNATTLSQLFTSLNSGNIVFGLNDVDPGDQFYDFTQGLSASLVNVGTGPVVTPGGGSQQVPEPFTIVGTLIGGTAALRMRKRLKATNKL
jgi:hypothetical protein